MPLKWILQLRYMQTVLDQEKPIGWAEPPPWISLYSAVADLMAYGALIKLTSIEVNVPYGILQKLDAFEERSEILALMQEVVG